MLICALGLFACLQAQAQVTVRIKMDKPTYLVGEPVTATISITNHAGRQLVLSGDRVSSWLNFQLSLGGRAVPPARKINYKPAVIPVGETIARTVNISTVYSLGNMGNYTCSASVKMSGPTLNGFTSNRAHFTVTGGRTTWVQRAGLPGSPDQIREYKLITFTGNRGLDLYAQVGSTNTGRRIATIPLGKIITFRNPSATLDKSSNMHALYQVKPEIFAHATISPNGQLLSSSFHKRGATGAPRLVTLSGEVRVAGSVPYKPEEEAAKKRQVRNISERPSFIYR